MGNHDEKKQKKVKKDKIKPNLFAWWFYTFMSIIIMWFRNHVTYKRKVFQKRNKKEGCVVLYNHFSNQDHFIITSAIHFARTNFVIAKYFYFNKTLTKVLNVVRAISKDQFKPDMPAIRKMKRVVDAKGILAIAPAGQVSIHGDTPYIDPAIVKLLKLCKADVYTLQIHGTYLSYPKWRKKKRHCNISAEFVKTFSKEELKVLPDEAVYQKICQDITIKEHEEQKQWMRPITGKGPIEGLEAVLYRCPECGSKYQLETIGKIMTCTHCGNKIMMDQYGFLRGVGSDYTIFENEAQWYYWQKHKLVQEIKRGSFLLQDEFYLLRNIDEEWVLENVGQGTLTLTNHALFYDGMVRGETIHKEFVLDSLVQLPFSPGKHFEIPNDEGTYKFKPVANPNVVIEWVQAIDAMHELRKQKSEE